MEEAETDARAALHAEAAHPLGKGQAHATSPAQQHSPLALAWGSGTYDSRVAGRKAEPLRGDGGPLLPQLSLGRGSCVSDSQQETATVHAVTPARKPARKQAKAGAAKGAAAGLACDHCGRRNSPAWRKGPPTAPRLCNACGTRFAHHRTLEGYLPGQRSREEEAGPSAGKAPQQRSPRAGQDESASPRLGLSFQASRQRPASPSASQRSPLSSPPPQRPDWPALAAEAKARWGDWRAASCLLAEAAAAARGSAEPRDRGMAAELERAQRLFWTNRPAALTLLEELSDVEVLFALSSPGSGEGGAAAEAPAEASPHSWQALVSQAHALGSSVRPERLAQLTAAALKAAAGGSSPDAWLLGRLQAVLQLLAGQAGPAGQAGAVRLLGELAPVWGACQACGKRRLLGRPLRPWEAFACGDGAARLPQRSCDAPEDLPEDWVPPQQAGEAAALPAPAAGSKRRRADAAAEESELDMLASAAEAASSEGEGTASAGRRSKRPRSSSLQGEPAARLAQLPPGWQCQVTVTRLPDGLSAPQTAFVCPLSGARVSSLEAALLLAQAGGSQAGAAAAQLQGSEPGAVSSLEAAGALPGWGLQMQLAPPSTPRLQAKPPELQLPSPPGLAGLEWAVSPKAAPGPADVGRPLASIPEHTPAVPVASGGIGSSAAPLPKQRTQAEGQGAAGQGFRAWRQPGEGRRGPPPSLPLEAGEQPSVRIVTNTQQQQGSAAAAAPEGGFPGFSRGFATVTSAAGLREAGGGSPRADMPPPQAPRGRGRGAGAKRGSSGRGRRGGSSGGGGSKSKAAAAAAAARLASAPSMTDLSAQGLQAGEQPRQAQPAAAAAATEAFRFPEQRQQLGRAISDPQVLKRELERGLSPPPHPTAAAAAATAEAAAAAAPEPAAAAAEQPTEPKAEASLTLDQQWQQLCARQQAAAGGSGDGGGSALPGRPLGRAISDPAAMQQQLAETLAAQTGYLPAATSLVTWQAAVTLAPREGAQPLQLFSLVAALPVRLAASLPAVLRVSHFTPRSQIYMTAVADKPLLLRLGPVDERQRGAVVQMEELKLAAVARLADGCDLALIPHINARNSLHVVGLKMDQGAADLSRRHSGPPEPSALPEPAASAAAEPAASAAGQPPQMQALPPLPEAS